MAGGEIIEVGVVHVPMVVDQAPVEAQLKALEQAADRTGKSMAVSLRQGTREVVNSIKEHHTLLSVISTVAFLIGGLFTGAWKTAIGWISKGASTLANLSALCQLAVARGLRLVSAQAIAAGGGLATLGRMGAVVATGLEGAARISIMFSAVLTGMTVAAGAATAALVIMAHRAASEFEPAWDRVLTLLDNSGGKFFALRGEVSRLAAELGTDGKVAANTFYDIISAIPALAQEPARAVGILRVALEDAETGFTDATTSGKALTAMLNAFHLRAEQAEEVSGALFKTQQLGVTTFGEIAQSIGTVADLASSLKGRYQDVLGIIATTTDTQVSTQERLTQLRGVISAIIKPTDQAKEATKDFSVQLSAADLSARGLNDFLLQLIADAKGNPDVLAKIFPQESLGLMISLARQTDVLREKTAEIGNAEGVHADNVRKMNDNWAAQKRILGRQFPGLMRDLGFQFESFGTKALKALNGVLFAMRGLDEEGKKLARTPSPWEDMEAHEREQIVLLERLKKLREGEEARAAHAPVPGRGTLGLQVTGLTPVTAAPAAKGPLSEEDQQKLLEKAQAAVQVQERLGRAQAAADYDRTRNAEAYRAALERAQESVNRLVIAESARLRAAGVAEAKVAELMSLYQVVESKSGEEHKRLLDEAARLRQDLGDKLAALTATATDEARRALDAFEKELRERVAKAGETLSAADEEALRKLHAAAAASGDLEKFRSELQSISDQSPTPQQVSTLDAFIGRMQEYVAANGGANGALAEGTELREQINRLLQDAIRLYGQSTKAIQDEAKETAEAEKKKRDELRQTAEERTRRLQDQARAIEENARAAVQLAEAFGAVNSESAQMLENVGQLAAAVVRIAGGDLTAIPSAIGAFASLLSSARGSREEAEAAQLEAQRALLEQLQRNREALEQNTAAIAGGKTAGEITAGQAGTLGLEDTLGKNIIRGAFDQRKVKALLSDPEAVARLQAISKATGIDLLSAAQQAAQSKTMAGLLVFTTALSRAQEILKQSAEHFGAIADSNIAGQMERFRQEVDLLDLDTPAEQLEHFLAVLHEIGAGSFADQLAAKVSSGDTAGARKMVQDIFEQLVTGQLSAAQITSLFGAGVTPEDIRQILSDVNGWLEQIATGGGVTAGGAVSSRLSVSMTEVEANQLLTVQTSMLFRLTNIEANTSAMVAAMLGRPVPSPSVSVSLPSPIGRDTGGPTTVTVHRLMVEVAFPGAPGGMTRDELAGAARTMGREIGEGFQDGLTGRVRRIGRAYGIDNPGIRVSQQ